MSHHSEAAFDQFTLFHPAFKTFQRCISGSVTLRDVAHDSEDPPKSGSNNTGTKFIGGVRVGAKPRFHLQEFFGQYPEFQYDPTKPYIQEFYRMLGEFRWSRRSKIPEIRHKYKEARKGIRVAMYREFNDIYGVNGKDISIWHNILGVIDPGCAKLPASPMSCRKLIRTLFVNICDLVDRPILRVEIQCFISEGELSKYSKMHKKIYPLMILGETRSSLVDPLLRRIGKPNEDDPPLADHPDEIDPYASTSRNNDQENVLP